MNTLKLILRGVDAVPLLMPSGRKIIEATNNFLAVGFDYLVDEIGDQKTQQELDKWFSDWFKREALRARFTSNKRWGLVRGDAHFYIYANADKPAGERISIIEMDPRQVFLIEDDTWGIKGCHIVDTVSDWREDDPSKLVARRRTFRKTQNTLGQFTGEITTELTFWELAKWDDRDKDFDPKDRVRNAKLDQEATALPPQITQLPLYRWRNSPPQNSSWGHSQLTGLETLMYGINQSLTDEDATMVFQGLGMYVTNAAPPIDPSTGELTD